MDTKRTAQIRQNLITWFQEFGKDYPWRQTHDPWFILVSEVMLQQTTIATVIKRYPLWMEQYPTPFELAQASEEEALRSWEGLGYYRRVRSLKKIAEILVKDHQGRFPTDIAEIKKLPGIGDYTAGALTSFAYNQASPIVDANVARVIARLDYFIEPVDATAGMKYLWQRATELVDPHQARIFNSALMELGQTLCNKQPDCLLCPIREQCIGQKYAPEQLPVKLPKAQVTAVEHHDILCIHDGKILLAKAQQGRHVGMYRFPQRESDAFLDREPLYSQKYSVTRYKVTRHIHLVSKPDSIRDDEEFVPLQKLVHIPFASPDRKALHSSAISQIIHRYLS